VIENYNIEETIDSLYMTGSWLQRKLADRGRHNVVVKIAAARMEPVGQSKETKLVVEYEGIRKLHLPNKTARRKLAELFGVNTSAWIGRAVSLTTMPSMFQGRATISIVIEAVPTVAPAATTPVVADAAQQGPLGPEPPASELSDDIPNAA
jgi:hypothetical protein